MRLKRADSGTVKSHMRIVFLDPPSCLDIILWV